MAQRLNLGILAHVDAGKTTLTERLLYAAGVISELGSVDAGTTQTDALDLERRRGITIKAAVAAFEASGVEINLIDTPGHPDFIAEVERSLRVLDGAVLVVSAVEGIQPQTRVLMRALRRLGIPALVFVNKIDRMGADPARVQAELAHKLGLIAPPMGEVRDPGTPQARFVPHHRSDPSFGQALAASLAETDEALLAQLVDGPTLPAPEVIWELLKAQTACMAVHPVFFGSALTGAGTEDLVAGITILLPLAGDTTEEPLSAAVFKIDRGPAGEKVVYVRVFSGQLRVRDLLEVRGRRERVSAIRVFQSGGTVQTAAVHAGQIGQLWGLTGCRIGDILGQVSGRPEAAFAPPSLESVISPVRSSDIGAMHSALVQLAEADPLITLRQDDTRGEIYLSLFGEVQKEVIADTLAAEFGLEVEFAETTIQHIERPVAVATCVELVGGRSNPFNATVGLRVEPGPLGSGLTYKIAVELGSMPASFHTAVEEAVRETLTQGLYGWPVTDCHVTLVASGYPTGSTPADARNLTPMVMMSALSAAGTVVLEPVLRYQVELPEVALRPTTALLSRLQAPPGPPLRVGALYQLDGEIQAGRLHLLRVQLPGVTHGEGTLETEPGGYRPVQGAPPSRVRVGPDPFNRREYMMHFNRVI